MLKDDKFNPLYNSAQMLDIVKREFLYALNADTKILIILNSLISIPDNISLDLDILYFGFNTLHIDRKIKTRMLVLADFDKTSINCEMFEGVEELILIDSRNVQITNMPNLRVLQLHECSNITVDEEVKRQIELIDIILDVEKSIDLMDYFNLKKISIIVRKKITDGPYIIYLPPVNKIDEVRMSCTCNIILSNTDSVKFLTLINNCGENNGSVIRMFLNLVNVSFE
jgi:hypothetical protein